MNEDFYGSIDRLVEFGMSSKVADAMINAMNQTMANMQMPNYQRVNQINMQSNVAVPTMPQKKFFVGIDNAPVGPLDMDELKQKIALKEVTTETLVWYQGLPGWAQAKTLSEVNILFSQVPPEIPTQEPLL